MSEGAQKGPTLRIEKIEGTGPPTGWPGRYEWSIQTRRTMLIANISYMSIWSARAAARRWWREFGNTELTLDEDPRG